MDKFIFSAIITLFIISNAAYSHADIYKYVDENGVIHLTNMPKHDRYKKVIDEHGRKLDIDYAHIIHRKSAKYGIKPSLIKAVIKTESNWDPEAVSSKGAIGLMQLMPETARDMRITNPYDPEENIEAGTRYLRYLLDRFNSDLGLALAAYNAGPSTVEKHGGIPSIPETVKFVRNVLSRSRLNPENAQIHKVSLTNGSTLYTNTSVPQNNRALPNF